MRSTPIDMPTISQGQGEVTHTKPQKANKDLQRMKQYFSVN